MTLYRWGMRGPFDELLRFQRQMSQLMDTWGDDSRPAAMPPVNLYDDGEEFHVRAELPGLDREKLDLSVAGDVLTLKATRKPEEFDGSYHRRERGGDTFSRSVNLPDTVDVDAVRATYVNGILEVSLPRAAEVRPRKISIEAR